VLSSGSFTIAEEEFRVFLDFYRPPYDMIYDICYDMVR
jgi:hypothetical protein